MSLLDSASLICTPNGYKEGKLYSVIPSDGSGDLSVVRATTATRVNSAGLVELVPYNLIRRSEEFNLIWSPVRSSITANSTTAPDGTLTADTLIDDTNNNIHYIAQAFTAINGAATISVYAKANQISQIQLVAQQGTTPMGRGFDLSTGTVFTESVGGVISNDLGQSITDVGNGWYRCEMSWTSTGQNEFWILLSVSNAATFTGTGANGVFIWGAQLVEGSTAKDYQKTETRLNIPRLDYSNGTCPSLLVEPQRTNLALYSSSFDNAYWAKVNTTVTPNVGDAPDGTTTADRLQIDGGAFNSISRGFAALNTTVTTSIWVKANSVSNNTFRLYTDSITGTVFTATNEWQRISVTKSVINGQIIIAVPSNAAAVDILIWGAQLEVGTYPTSYIPTTSASVTRNEESLSSPSIPSLFGSTEGSFFIELTFDGLNGNGAIPLFLRSSVSNQFNHATYLQFGSSAISLAVYNGGTLQATITGGTFTNGQNLKVGFAYKANDFVLYVNGIQIGTDTSGSISSSLSFIDLGSYLFLQSTFQYNGSIKAAALWPTRLTNTQLAQLTTI
jgi:hypothetical protein